MQVRKKIVLKLTGELFLSPDTRTLSAKPFYAVAQQIKQLQTTHDFGIVIGGGNFFRGSQHGKQLGLTPQAGHTIGMLATMMNGIVIQDLLAQHDICSTIFSALDFPYIGCPVTSATIGKALATGSVLIFTGGTGNPFFTTDTSAILRGLQMNADEVWKGTTVDGVYSADPRTDKHARLLPRVSYAQALEQRYGVLDTTAFALGAEHNMPIRVFNIFSPNILLNIVEGHSVGSLIT